MSFLKTVESDVEKGGKLIWDTGKAFVRNVIGGDVQKILKKSPSAKAYFPRKSTVAKKGIATVPKIKKAKSSYYPRAKG